MDARQAALIMIQGPEPGSLYKLPDNRVTTIGRSSRNTIRSVSSNVSRFHCEVSCVNGRWELTDLNSKKGTIVNGELIGDVHVLKPGDIVRLGTTVFRFDMIDETMLDDGAMVALMEAELDQKLVTKGEATASLEDIRARSRMEVRDSRRSRTARRSALRTNLAFLAAVLAAVGIVVTAGLLYAHRRAVPSQERREREARRLHGEAAASLEAGKVEAALARWREVRARFPDTEAAADAREAAAELIWREAQRELDAVAGAEAEGDFAGALDAYAGIERLQPERPLPDVLKRRREYTVRLAHASFRVAEAEAERRAQEGDVAAASRIYRSVAERVGVPELAARARDAADELQPPNAP
jgi:pSer/pThr/pTyr-binding forkhead associated (FHA) protein